MWNCVIICNYPGESLVAAATCKRDSSLLPLYRRFVGICNLFFNFKNVSSKYFSTTIVGVWYMSDYYRNR